MGGENGWSSWQGRAGTIANNNAAVTWGPVSSPPPASNGNTAFTLNTGAGFDGCTPAAGNPTLPLVAPGFGNFSIMLGVPREPNAFAEQISFSLLVGPADTNFIYCYAIVLDNPADGNHVGKKAPHAEIYILGPKGDTVACSHQLYFGSNDNTLPDGFYQTDCGTGSNAYKPWTTVGVNLGGYLGKTVTVVVSNYDCSLGGHFCLSYWDFMCPPLASGVTPFCLGQASTMTAPSSGLASNPYKYTWYKNTKPYDPKKHWTPVVPAQTGINYTTIPMVGDTFAVNIGQGSKCNFWIPFIPQIKTIVADCKAVNNCGAVTFTDASPPPNTGTITNWNWSFPGGNPSTSTSQNQVVIYTTAGIHTATLNITSSEGCVATKTLTVTTGDPAANFTTGPVCQGLVTSFADGSASVPGDPIKTWDWNFGDGSTLSQQNASHIYAGPGTYSVNLNITTQGGCTTTITHTVTVNPIPDPKFISGNVCFNIPTVFTNQSTGAVQYEWDFGDGTPISTALNPTHTYGTVGTFSVMLSVTNSFGCKDKYPLPTVVNPVPVVDFTFVPVCLGDSTCFKDVSNVTPGQVVAWNWSFGDGSNSSTLQNPCHIYNGVGPFTVALTATSDSGCQNNIMLPVTSAPPPKAAFIPHNVCLNSLTTFIDASVALLGAGNEITAWNWDFGDGTPHETVQSPPHLYVKAGTYTITLIVTTKNGCVDTAHNTVVIYAPPVPLFSQPAKGCTPVYANYADLSTSADGKVDDWKWSFPGGVPSSSTVKSPPTIKYTEPGTYSVSLVVSSEFGCTDSIQLPMVDVYSWPTADFCVSPKVAPVTDPTFSFCDMWSKNVAQWSWDFGDASPLDVSNTDPIHSYSATANQNDFYTKQICIRVETQYGCWATACHSVDLIPEFVFYIPNTFTPNGDEHNEFFYGKCRGVKDYNIWLFDRWGNQVWDCHHSDKNINWDNDLISPQQEGLASYCKWDGIVVQGGLDMGGNSRAIAQEDVYVWKVQLTDIFNKHHTYIGHVNIVK
jgi:PKD repeat protein